MTRRWVKYFFFTQLFPFSRCTRYLCCFIEITKHCTVPSVKPGTVFIFQNCTPIYTSTHVDWWQTISVKWALGGHEDLISDKTVPTQDWNETVLTEVEILLSLCQWTVCSVFTLMTKPLHSANVERAFWIKTWTRAGIISSCHPPTG